jgi:hypothetical protein
MPPARIMRIFSVPNLCEAIEEKELFFSSYYHKLGILEMILKDLNLIQSDEMPVEHCLLHYTESIGIPREAYHITYIYGPDMSEIIGGSNIFNNHHAANKELGEMIEMYLTRPSDGYTLQYTIITIPKRLPHVTQILSTYPTLDMQIVMPGAKILKPESI